MKRRTIRHYRVRKNKFGARRCWSAIIKRYFDSDAECRYGEYLFARQQNGEIRDLEFQVEWPIVVNGVRIGHQVMRIDFRYYDPSLTKYDARGQLVYDEYKGFPTAVWKHRKDLWAASGPGPLRVTKERKGALEHWICDEIIWPANYIYEGDPDGQRPS